MRFAADSNEGRFARRIGQLQSVRIDGTPESERARSIIAGGHQQKLSVLIVAIRFREVPNRALRLVVTAATKNPCPSMFIDVLIGPLPHVAYEIHHPERASTTRVGVHLVGPARGSTCIRHRNRGTSPFVAPRISSPVGPLRCKLPLPLVRKPFARPFRVSACVFQ